MRWHYNFAQNCCIILQIRSRLAVWRRFAQPEPNSSEICVISSTWCDIGMYISHFQQRMQNIEYYASRTHNLQNYKPLCELSRQTKAFCDFGTILWILVGAARQTSIIIAPGVNWVVWVDDSSDFEILPSIAECFHQFSYDVCEISDLCRQNESVHFMDLGIMHISLDQAQ